MYLDYSVLAKLYPGFKVYGPYLGDDGRRRVVFKETNDGVVTRQGTSFSMSYARAIMISIEGRILSPEEEVDHRDEDRSNDHPSNLRILSKDDHDIRSRISVSKNQSNRKLVTCPACLTAFMCPMYRIKAAETKGKKPCCSRSCSSRYYGSNQYM